FHNCERAFKVESEKECPTRRWRWTGQSRAVFERQRLIGSFCLYHSFSVIVAQPLSFTCAAHKAVFPTGESPVLGIVCSPR
ncbi:MAG: hypothetical protein LWX02_11735, partial [Deltaproteobacteria bacterium]|nr:hypothetical protein [Deltaproteobacteria bacterium]MDL1986345.1 hypothetical protein [Deltaproteobacteria bacterium]